MLTKAQLRTASVILEEQNQISLHDLDTGEVVTTFTHKPGVYDGSFFAKLLPGNMALDGEGVVILQRGGTGGVVRIKVPFESGANHDFKRHDPLATMRAELMQQINGVARKVAASRADLIGESTPKAQPTEPESEVIEEPEAPAETPAETTDEAAD